MSAEKAPADFQEVAGAIAMVRRAALALAVAVALILGAWRGPMWGLGALVGGLLVGLNLCFLLKLVRNARPGRLQAPLWVTVVEFNAAFVGTMIACYLIVKFRIGEPLGFLAGLAVFLPSMVAGLFRYSHLKAKAAEAAAQAAPASGPEPAPEASPGQGPPAAGQ
jgi:F0F1-type ATP synthase assembly protein I